MNRTLALNRMVIDPKQIQKIEREFDQFYFRQYEKAWTKTDDLAFKLQHRLKGLTAKISIGSEIIVDDNALLNELQELVHQSILDTLFKIFGKSASFDIEMVLDSTFIIRFSTPNCSGKIITNSEEFYVVLDEILYAVLKEEQGYSVTEYFCDQKEYIPVGKKHSLEEDFLKAMQDFETLPYEDLAPDSELIRRTIHLYKVPILKNDLDEAKLGNQNKYWILQK